MMKKEKKYYLNSTKMVRLLIAVNMMDEKTRKRILYDDDGNELIFEYNNGKKIKESDK